MRTRPEERKEDPSGVQVVLSGFPLLEKVYYWWKGIYLTYGFGGWVVECNGKN